MGDQWHSRSLASLESPILIIPIFLDSRACKSQDHGAPVDMVNHWAVLVKRKGVTRDKFEYYDSINSHSYLNIIKHAILKTPILQKNKSCTWELIQCTRQLEYECGARMVLHMAMCTMPWSCTKRSFMNLRNISNLSNKCRSWMKTSIEQNVIIKPNWI